MRAGPGMENAERELAVHMNHTGPDYRNTLGCLIGYLKDKNTKKIIIRNPKVLKAVMFCDYKYATNKETRISAIGLVTKLGGTILMCSLKTQRTIPLSSMESEYVALLAFTQEVKFVDMFLEEMSEDQ